MRTPISDLIDHVDKRLRSFGFSAPSPSVLDLLFQTAYLASLRTEEGRFVRPSITYADPKAPDLHPPLTKRAQYPSISAFTRPMPMTIELVVKLSRAIDKWSGSIAVYGVTKTNIVVWGVVDQFVQRNVRLHRETDEGFNNPGILTIDVDGVADLSAYHGTIFLGSMRGHRLILRENDILHSDVMADRIKPALAPAALGIAQALTAIEHTDELLQDLFAAWANTISRLCIGLRRAESGGAFLITPVPNLNQLKITYDFKYNRLGDSMILRVLDEAYLYELNDIVVDDLDRDELELLHIDIGLAEADARDRESEVTAAVKLVTSLAVADGLVLLTPDLRVLGFGVKIGSEGKLSGVFDGVTFQRRKSNPKTVDPTAFGTRHNSMLRYCQSDQAAVGIVVSQDGHVRIIMSQEGKLTLSNDIKLLGHIDYSFNAARRKSKWMAQPRSHEEYSLGYTTMPKTISELLSLQPNNDLE